MERLSVEIQFTDRVNEEEWTILVSSPKKPLVEHKDVTVERAKSKGNPGGITGGQLFTYLTKTQQTDVLFDAAEALTDKFNEGEGAPGVLDDPEDYDDETGEDDP